MTFATLNENGPYQSVRNPYILDFLFQNSRFHAWVDLPFLIHVEPAFHFSNSVA